MTLSKMWKLSLVIGKMTWLTLFYETGIRNQGILKRFDCLTGLD